LYLESATDMYGNKGRLFIHNAKMVCKSCTCQKDRYTVKSKSLTNLKHHLLKSGEGSQDNDLEKYPNVVDPKATDWND
jgi:hypothetical protein